ncbi:UBN2 domain-containing protein [Cephalotus follicularis]|uniref:UBN2 domain-containing protein n=1 Tax=Cephalotus follicularis TaxID=3775 RepID=A0A1Q3AM03_CEPFO|nr:UBN2 domain-containing protein [Cephalotus follicularis]
MRIADIDLAMISDMPPDITDTSSLAEREHHANWERSNILCLMAMKRSISKHLLDGLPETNDAREFFAAVGDRYQVSSNAEVGSLVSELTGLRYDGLGGVRDHILRMVHLQSKLRARDIPLPDSYVVSHSLNSLLVLFSQIKTAYNTQSESWSINDLITKCVAEKEKNKKEKSDIALFVSHPKHNSDKGFRGKSKYNALRKFQAKKNGNNNGQLNNAGGPKPAIKKIGTSHFCKKHGHYMNVCFKFKSWLERKQPGNSLALVCFESYFIDVPSDSWWLNSGVTVHVAFTLQGFISKRKPSDLERKLKVGNNVDVDVEFVRDISLCLGFGFCLVLKNTFYVPSFRRNLVSLSTLDKEGYCFNFGNSKVQLSLNSQNIGECFFQMIYIDCV